MSQLPIRFMYNNFLESSFTYSSQYSASFPASYAYNSSRSRLWRTGGNFEVKSTNCKIYINDGSNKTVTLTTGSYTYTTLATEMQTQLNISSSNWTVTYSTTTNKFVIARSSGTKILRLSVTTDAAWDMLGFTQSLDQVVYSPDESRIHTSEWLQCDMGVPQKATFMALLGEIDATFGLSTNAVVKIRANNIDNWTSPGLDISVTPAGGSVMSFFDDSSSVYRYWRIEIIDRENTLGPTGLYFSYAYLGDHLTLANTNIASGFSKSYTDPSNTVQSESGAIYIEERPRYLEYSSSEIQLITDDDRDNLEQFFYDVGIRTPFFVSLDPGLEVSTNLPDNTRLMIMTESPQFSHVYRGYYNVSFSMREAF
jgi:hypothetical protein